MEDESKTEEQPIDQSTTSVEDQISSDINNKKEEPQQNPQEPTIQPPSIRETLGYVFGRVFERGQKELTRVAHDSKERLLLRSLRKDRLKLYEKIGREVEQLILTGDIKHPGLEKRIKKIREIEEHIGEVESRLVQKENIENQR